ncbi:MAG: thioesterase family protein, partial [Caldisphaeraceae archaeon]|nr:thioesterase family protein [Caldisphaeraceae archaeon]MEB3691266.1 thioesterase family protein [Caldisphaeraceae archaeon]
DYKSILRPGDAYRVTITEIQLGKRSIRYFYEIYNETLERLSAICKIVTVFYDETSGKSVELPKELREKLLERGAKIVENYK